MTTDAISDEKKPYAFVSGKRFLEWPSDSRIYYVAGIIDALSYLTEVADHQRGLSDCLSENPIDETYPITWQLIARDAVTEAAKDGDARAVSVPEQLFDKIKLVCRDYYRKQRP